MALTPVDDAPDRFSPTKLWLLIGIGALIRFIFMGLMDLLPEEAYYWSYAQHIDIGYLDHPPMVAWLIYVSQSILGKSEFAVRLPAFLGWFAMAFFMYRLARNLFDKTAATGVILLLAALPIYMSIGFLMTPDAPFYVMWAGCLFFLERALLAGRGLAWVGVGVCLGLGLLSKYTIGLIVPATIVFMIADKSSRRWFRKPQPYLAAVIALVLFLPVIYWNHLHDWASFAFQGSRRWWGEIDFYFHVLIGSALILITPLGVVGAVRGLMDCWKRWRTSAGQTAAHGQKHLFMLVFTVVPLMVFIIHSFRGQPKLNWTGPVWLAILPLVALYMRPPATGAPRHWARLSAGVWIRTAIVLLLLYAAGFGYIVGGMPGAPVLSGMPAPAAWQEFGSRVGQIAARLELETGSQPVIVGFDEYATASELSFYYLGVGDLKPMVGSENLVGGNGLMWNYWMTKEKAKDRHTLLVSFRRDKLDKTWVFWRFSKLTDISSEVLNTCNGKIGTFYWRVGYDYRY